MLAVAYSGSMSTWVSTLMTRECRSHVLSSDGSISGHSSACTSPADRKTAGIKKQVKSWGKRILRGFRAFRVRGGVVAQPAKRIKELALVILGRGPAGGGFGGCFHFFGSFW